jgi:DNA replication protein DnaC
MELATCKFIPKGENIVFVGKPGTGKTHLSVALAMQALSYGYSTLFSTVCDMITTLQQSRADLSYRKKIDHYSKPDLLVLDELGYKTMSETTVEDFFEIVSKRHERKSVIITSNRPISEWNKILLDKILTGALTDRLLQKCHVIEIPGESYRAREKHI